MLYTEEDEIVFIYIQKRPLARRSRVEYEFRSTGAVNRI